MIIKIFAKADIPFSLLGIRRGPLLESDCSSNDLLCHDPDYEGHQIKNETFAIMQLFNMQDFRNIIQNLHIFLAVQMYHI